MLSIYVGKENLPKDKVFYFDVNGVSLLLDLTRDDLTAKILRDIEQATPQTSDSYIDRFGRGLYSTTLSTSTRILLALHQLDYVVVNGDEIGGNAFCYLNNIKSGHLYFSSMSRDIDELDTPICLNGKVCNDENDLWDTYAVYA